MGALACGSLDTYADDIARIRASLPGLADEIAGFIGIGQVVDWMAARNSEQPSIDIVAMDEFEYDFLIELKQETRWLAFGVT